MHSALGVIFNPISGAGRGRALAEEISAAAAAHGYDARVFESTPAYAPGEIERILQGLSALIIVGGDGTLMPFLAQLATTKIPVTMYPAGNESLFARAFSSRADLTELFRKLSERRTVSAGYGLVNGKPFFAMVSVGLDADVIAAIAATRNRAIGKRGYVAPTFRAFVNHRPPLLSIVADGKDVVSAERGYFVAANVPDYACSLNPVPEARCDAPLLSARFYPYNSRWAYLPWLAAIALRNKVSTGRSRLIEAAEFVVSSSDSRFVQADGEFIGQTPITISRGEGTIEVLL